jgi:TetR/AcrR family transcriptional repressor of nem operon
LAVLERACESEKACITETLSGDGDPIKTVEGMFAESAARMKKGGCHKGCFIGNVAQEISDESEAMRVKISDHLGFWTGELAAFLARGKARGYFKKAFEPASAAQAVIALLEGATLMSKATKKSEALTNAGAVAAGYLKAQRG